MPFINSKELADLEHKAQIFKRCSMQTYWMHQGFVKDFLDEYLMGNSISSLRDKFDADLEAYVNERCAEKLKQANELIALIEKINLRDPFYDVRLAIEKFKGDR